MPLTIDTIELKLTDAEIESSELRASRAHALFDEGVFPTVGHAQQWLDILASRQRGEPQLPEVTEFFDAGAEMLANWRELQRKHEVAIARVEERVILNRKRDSLAWALAFESDRLKSYDGFEARWRDNYKARLLGNGYFHNGQAIEFFKNVVAERALISHLGAEVIPGLKDDLAAAERALAEFESTASSALDSTFPAH